jgi:hypothetical protein
MLGKIASCGEIILLAGDGFRGVFHPSVIVGHSV